MTMIQITEENFKKAHAEGCADVKQVLETLAPEQFGSKFPYFTKGPLSDAIYLQINQNQAIRLTDGRLPDDAVGKIGEIIKYIPGNNPIIIKGIKEDV
jgi:hypothetical protein